MTSGSSHDTDRARMSRNTVEGLAAVRSDVERVCGLLVSGSPELLDGCPALLQRACCLLGEFRPWLREARGEEPVLKEALRLQAAVRHAGRLLENAHDYHARWNQILGTMTGGYNQHGSPAPVTRPGRVHFTG